MCTRSILQAFVNQVISIAFGHQKNALLTLTVLAAADLLVHLA